MLEEAARNGRVGRDIEKTPHFAEAYARLKAKVEAHEGVVYLGCTGGHHRSVYLAERIAREIGVEVVHLNFDDK